MTKQESLIKRIVRKPLFLPLFSVFLVLVINVVYDAVNGDPVFGFFYINISFFFTFFRYNIFIAWLTFCILFSIFWLSRGFSSFYIS